MATVLWLTGLPRFAPFIVPFRVYPSCGNAGRWEEALQLINKLETLALKGGGVPMSTTLYNFAIDAVRKFFEEVFCCYTTVIGVARARILTWGGRRFAWNA